jgi:predicted short-subunit dehydrogenase-like oxidoreductase (DUF2520 family)
MATMPRSGSAASPGVAGRPARLAVGVVSAGRVGSVLGAAVSGAGHVVVGVSAVSRASLRRAAHLLPDAPVLAPDDVVRRSDLVLLAVPDDVLPGLVSGLAATGAFRAGQIVVHTSGARGVDVLAPATAVGVLPLALHPAMTFTGRAEDVARLAAACVGVTVADELGWSVGEALVLEMGAEPVRVPPEARLTGPIIWPLWCATPWTRWSTPVWCPPNGCWARCWRRRWITRCATATAR